MSSPSMYTNKEKMYFASKCQVKRKKLSESSIIYGMFNLWKRKKSKAMRKPQAENIYRDELQIIL